MSFKPMYNCITFLKRWLIIIFLLIRWNEANMVNYLEDDAYTDKEYLLTFHTSTSSSNNNVVDDKRSPRTGLPIFHPPILTWSFRRRRPWQRRQRRPWLPLKMERKQEKFDAAGKTGKNFRWGEKKNLNFLFFYFFPFFAPSSWLSSFSPLLFHLSQFLIKKVTLRCREAE